MSGIFKELEPMGLKNADIAEQSLFATGRGERAEKQSDQELREKAEKEADGKKEEAPAEVMQTSLFAA